MPRGGQSRSYLRRCIADTNSALRGKGLSDSQVTTDFSAVIRKQSWGALTAVGENSDLKEGFRWAQPWRFRGRRRVQIWGTTRVLRLRFSWHCLMCVWAGGWETRAIRKSGRVLGRSSGSSTFFRRYSRTVISNAGMCIYPMGGTLKIWLCMNYFDGDAGSSWHVTRMRTGPINSRIC